MSLTTVPINDLSRISSEERDALTNAASDAIASGSYVLGSRVTEFEDLFAHYVGSPHIISTASGTDALVLALAALDLPTGSTVATVANAGGYATTAIHSVSLTAHFVDIDPESHLMDPQALEAALDEDSAISAVIVTHLYGNPAHVALLQQICEAASIPMVEDCAQATGLRTDDRHVGTFGAIGTFSFFPTKNLGALGDGGAVITGDPELAARVQSLRQYGWSNKYRVELLGGINSRLDEIQAAFLTLRLQTLDRDNQRRREICNAYDAALASQESHLIWNGTGVGHLAVLEAPNRDVLQEHFTTLGIGHAVHYPIPDHQQPAWSKLYADIRLPVTEQKASEICTIPCFPNMTGTEVERVAEALSSFVG